MKEAIEHQWGQCEGLAAQKKKVRTGVWGIEWGNAQKDLAGILSHKFLLFLRVKTHLN